MAVPVGAPASMTPAGTIAGTANRAKAAMQLPQKGMPRRAVPGGPGMMRQPGVAPVRPPGIVRPPVRPTGQLPARGAQPTNFQDIVKRLAADRLTRYAQQR